jgi:UDP:flavonoid glycosyltransferase YjiC (YdhE family)
MFGALSHGLPSVVLPQGADNFDNGTMRARRVADDIRAMASPADVAEILAAGFGDKP